MALRAWAFLTDDPPPSVTLGAGERRALAYCSRCDWTCDLERAQREGGPIRALLAHNLARHLGDTFNRR